MKIITKEEVRAREITAILSEAQRYTLNNFLGNEDTKKEIHEICTQISGGKIFRTMGVKPDKSFMFYGDNGTGKTFAVKCLAGELAKQRIPALIKEYEIGKHGTAYINMGSVILQRFFDLGEKIIQHKDSLFQKVLYVFDEAEVLMGKRGRDTNGHKEDDKLLETLMINLQRISDSNEGQYVFFMTNKIELIDEASIRSGRINRKVEFKKPDFEARYLLFQRAIQEINDRATHSVVRTPDLEQLAKNSEGFNCIDCIEIPARAVKKRATEILEEKRSKTIPAGYVTQKRLLDEIEKQKRVYSKTSKARIGFE